MMILAVAIQLAEEAKKVGDPGLLNVLLSAGVAGACLIACGIWIKIKDASYEKRIDQMLADKDKFIASYIDMTTKYQSTMDKFATSLEVIITLVKNQQGKP
jgi:hypothetical protein